MLDSLIEAVRSFIAEIIIDNLALISRNCLLSVSSFATDVDADGEFSELLSSVLTRFCPIAMPLVSEIYV